MRILVIGGSGDVGSLVTPHLSQHHDLRVFDRRPPADPAFEYFAGDLNSLDDLTRAVETMDVVLFMAMGHKDFETTEAIITGFDVSVKGVYLALYAARRAGIKHAIYTSTLSIYADFPARYIEDENTPTPDATEIYGFTKRLGEEVCRNAVKAWGMSVNVLRLCHPLSEEAWQQVATSDQMTCHTTATDLARAILAAVDYRDGFQAFTITGDYQERTGSLAKARRLLNWEPLARPVVSE
jgi:nucleoside-diphosphate-sugar epimerase